MSGSDEEWIPPTEQELKVLAARRERSDKISKLMGDYMLKGYRMLATMCPMCDCVELQDKQGVKYCVACQEVDCHETSKDNPALSQRAAIGVRAEEAFNTPQRNNLYGTSSPSPSPGGAGAGGGGGGGAGGAGDGGAGILPTTVSATRDPDLIPRPEAQAGGGATPRVRQDRALRQFQTSSQSWSSAGATDQLQPLLASSFVVVSDKLAWATEELRAEQEVGRATALAVLVRELVTTIRAMTE